MEPLTKQLSALAQPLKPLQQLPRPLRYGLLALAGAVVLALAFVGNLAGQDHYQYVFTNLGAEDSTEVAEHLKAAAIPFRLEANGGAVAVPEAKVYDARLLLASAGLPRGGGVGFELFDRGDIGVSEFTQRVNLRRAIEGELARTIGHLAAVRSARVHLSFEEKTLFREDEHKAAAAVVLNLQPGRTLDPQGIAGIRHLVASSVPGLSAEGVTLVDGSGRALTDDDSNSQAHESGDLERTMEQRIVTLLETVVGAGAVVAKVSATVDDAEVTTNSEIYDPDSAALRSEHKSAQTQSQDTGAPSGVAGAAANQPLVGATQGPQNTSKGSSTNEDALRNYELSKTVTHTVKRSPRLLKLSSAVIIDGVNGKPRPAEEVTRLGEIAKRAIGFDAARGDVFEISSAAFARSSDEPVAAPPAAATQFERWKIGAAGAALLALLVAVFFVGRRGRATAGAGSPLYLKPGVTVSELEQGFNGQPVPANGQPATALLDPALATRTRALELAQKNPTRAAHMLRAWIAADSEANGAKHG